MGSDENEKVIIMFRNVGEMLDASKKLDESGITHNGITPNFVIVESEEDFAKASSILEDYDVEIILKIPTSRKEKTEAIFNKAIGFRDIFSILR